MARFTRFGCPPLMRPWPSSGSQSIIRRIESSKEGASGRSGLNATINERPRLAVALAACGAIYVAVLIWLFYGDPVGQEVRPGLGLVLALLALVVAGGELALRRKVNRVALAITFIALASALAVGDDDLRASTEASSLIVFGIVLLGGVGLGVLPLLIVIRFLAGRVDGGQPNNGNKKLDAGDDDQPEHDVHESHGDS